ncbi:type IV pili twitching motility protein PilT [Candidatus Shapirobacteria bacterium CG09_land_8_20_14_0_10_38_17]|uniref:Type IV pili twitching motility protein PilT n=1 Tax=Candidatus Shapirobacteria bacterium CG09_land_8_20_14_0_10_38_17 TaxID=1974884 RepID=A0A2H0WQY9_9BACT|nr:MAG: type IV pili twitching motility protein PilT [Candidatus Shapirobacteria bacterium CG09_land_8_20_14_0_10_38_17]
MVEPKAKIERFFQESLSRQASDLHLVVGLPPYLRVDGQLHPLPNEQRLTSEEVEAMVFSVCSQEQKEAITTNLELDFSFDYQDKARFRINAYYQMGALAASFRLIPREIKTIEKLSLPSICGEFTKLKQGFILVTGPTGHGKSTTIAAMLNEINEQLSCHIVTIEDPIEFALESKKAIVSQRELNRDTHSWTLALRSCLRQDPNVVFIGEMRDLETISAALTIAETGHLVFSTLHTNSAAQTVDRIVDVFPEGAKEQIRMQFSNVLEGVISQRLVPALSGGRLPAVEIMLGSTAIKTAIREGKSHMIDNIIQTSAEMGMMNLETSLANLVNSGKISLETAQAYALRPRELMRQAK